jgi:hypothetical protein
LIEVALDGNCGPSKQLLDLIVAEPEPSLERLPGLGCGHASDQLSGKDELEAIITHEAKFGTAKTRKQAPRGKRWAWPRCLRRLPLQR